MPTDTVSRPAPMPETGGEAARGLRSTPPPARTSDVVAAALLALVASFVLYDAVHYPPAVDPGAPGPAAFPRLLAILLIILCVLLVVNARRPVESSPVRPMSRPAMKRNATTLALLVAFVLVAERTDFFLAMAALIAALMFLLGERPRRIASVALLFVAFLYAVFYRLFGVLFPTVF